MNKHFDNEYASGKLHEFVRKIFLGVSPARQKLSENLHYIAIIIPEDFKNNDHQRDWDRLQMDLIGKTKNIGLRRDPIHQLKVHKKKLENALEIIWRLYEETCC